MCVPRKYGRRRKLGKGWYFCPSAKRTEELLNKRARKYWHRYIATNYSGAEIWHSGRIGIDPIPTEEEIEKIRQELVKYGETYIMLKYNRPPQPKNNSKC